MGKDKNLLPTNAMLLADAVRKHEDFVALDYTCIQCKKCKAISYHRDSGGTGQPKEAVWSKGICQ